MALNVTEGENASPTGNLVYDPDTLAWVRMNQPVVQADVVNVGGEVEVSGPLTDDELRATDVKVSLDGESVAVTGAFYPATQAVSGTFWPETQPVSAVSLPLPSGAATAAGVAALTKPSDVQHATLDDLATALHAIYQQLVRPMWWDHSTGRIRVAAETVANMSTLTTCSTVTNLTNFNTLDSRYAQMAQVWQHQVRNKIT